MGTAARTLLQRPSSRVDAVVDQLLVDLDDGDNLPVRLVIDDFQVVDDDEVVATSVARFVCHLPAWLHVVLTSRRSPNLPIDRMRSRGQIGEVGFAELRFSPVEAVQLLRALSPSLSEERIDAVVERADGWAASLQLAALAARSARAGPDVEASDQTGDLLVQDYVLNEILVNEEAATIDVLCAAAVVPRINALLARTLTGRPDAGELLVHAEHRGLFVMRFGPSGWFELHSLVREVLIAEMSSRSPRHLAEQHATAAQWFEDADEVVVALDQWMLADRPREVLRLLAATHADLYDNGLEATVRRVIAAIPATVATADLDSMISIVWCNLLVDRRRFLDLVDYATRWVERSPPDQTLRARVLMLESTAAMIGGRWMDGGSLAREAMVSLGDAWRRDPLGRFAWNAIGREIALSECWDDSSDDVRRAELALGRDPERRLSFEGTRAVGEALAGRPLDALRVAAGVRRAALVSRMTILRAELALAEAVAHRELGDRSRALAELGALAEAPAETMLYCRILATIELAAAHLDGGDLATAWDVFDRAKGLVEAESFGRDGRGWLARLGTLLALTDGNLVAALQWTEELVDPFWRGIGKARIHLATGNRAEAAGELATAVPRCVRHRVVLELLLARCVTDREEAEKHAATAVEMAVGNSLLQSIASEGIETVELVEQVAWRAPDEWLARLRRLADARTSSRADRSQLVEPLTERERDVLRVSAQPADDP